MFKRSTSTTKVSALIYLAWAVSLGATLASIYFIEIAGNSAGTLCWFERMLMFGLFLVLTAGILIRDKNLKYYTLPFILLGIPSATYQQLVHWSVIKVAPQPCSLSIICTTKYFELFGFATQATLCLAAFSIIAFCIWRSAKSNDVYNEVA